MEQENLLLTEVAPKKSKLPKVFFYVSMTLLLCAVIGYVLFNLYQSHQALQTKIDLHSRYVEGIQSQYQDESVPMQTNGNDALNHGLNEVATDAPLEGTFVFSSIRQDAVKPYIKIYTLDLGNKDAVSSELLPTYPTSAFGEYRNMSMQEEMFLVTTSEYSVSAEEDAYAIHLFDPRTAQVKPFDSTRGQAERNLAWSATTGLLAFNRSNGKKPTDHLSRLSIDNWETAVVDIASDAVQTIIANSSQPKWSPDGSTLVFLKTDGLYYKKLTEETEVKIIGVPEDGKIVTTSMIDVSKDGKYLAWTTAKTGVITLFEITSWETVSLTELGRIHIDQTEFYWPQFSPDGKYYAVQAIDSRENGTVRSNPRIEIRPLQSRDIVYRFDLKDFKFDSLFTDDWIPPKQVTP